MLHDNDVMLYDNLAHNPGGEGTAKKCKNCGRTGHNTKKCPDVDAQVASAKAGVAEQAKLLLLAAGGGGAAAAPPPQPPATVPAFSSDVHSSARMLLASRVCDA